MGHRPIRLFLLLILVLLWVPARHLAAEDEQHLLERWCFDCHGNGKHKGDLDLQGLFTLTLTKEHMDTWDTVRSNVLDQVMPPASKPQPSQAERERMASWIDRMLDGPDGDVPKDPGPDTIRRLTRNEFNRTIHDLLGVDGTPADAFPADSSGGSGSFDNNADALFVSPPLLENLLDVSLALIEKASPERLGLVAPVKDKAGVITDAAKIKAVQQSLSTFLERAWRRPVSASDLANLVRLYERTAKKPGIGYEDALHLTYAAALTSPNFLFRVEATKAEKDAYHIDAYAMASRLSYFLWSTMPDETLFAAARDGSLNRPEVVIEQTRRMLTDPRAEVFIRQFVGEWLGTAELATGSGPDPKQFPEYTPSLRAAMIEEPVAFFRALLTENRSVLDLIDCQYVYVNATLAQHYGLPLPAGDGFMRVAVSDDQKGQRGGVITMAGVLAITSRPSRTSPVIRGKWILDDLLSTPPPPPPPKVPPLPEATGANVGTLRQRLERHRADPACNSCHQRIDPLGFGLENFDALGRWRVFAEVNVPLDTTGTLPTGETFNGPQELKKLLMQRKERIVTTLVERLLSYALGRGLERCDHPTVRLIANHLGTDGYRAQTLISDIVSSFPFRMKRN